MTDITEQYIIDSLPWLFIVSLIVWGLARYTRGYRETHHICHKCGEHGHFEKDCPAKDPTTHEAYIESNWLGVFMVVIDCLHSH